MRDKISLGDVCKYTVIWVKDRFWGKIVPEDLCFYRKMSYSKNQEFRCIYLLYYSSKGGSVQTHPYSHMGELAKYRGVGQAPPTIRYTGVGDRACM